MVVDCVGNHVNKRMNDRLLQHIQREGHFVAAGHHGTNPFFDMRVLTQAGITLHSPAGWTSERLLETMDVLLSWVEDGTMLHASESVGLEVDLGFDCVGFSESVQNLIEISRQHVVIFGVLHGKVSLTDKHWLRGVRLDCFDMNPLSGEERDLAVAAIAATAKSQAGSLRIMDF